jgi:hypothetical protein
VGSVLCEVRQRGRRGRPGRIVSFWRPCVYGTDDNVAPCWVCLRTTHRVIVARRKCSLFSVDFASETWCKSGLHVTATLLNSRLHSRGGATGGGDPSARAIHAELAEWVAWISRRWCGHADRCGNDRGGNKYLPDHWCEYCCAVGEVVTVMPFHIVGGPVTGGRCALSVRICRAGHRVPDQ